MEFSDKDYECVVAKIFDGVNNCNKISAENVMKKIAPYLGNDRTEFLLLKDILDPHSENPLIDRDDLKSALLQWANNLKNEKDSCIIEDMSMISNFDQSGQMQYTSFCSLSSEGYRDRVLELQGEIAERDHQLRRMGQQLEHSAQLTQQHEETMATLIAERENLLASLAQEHSNSATSASLKKEYEEVMESLHIMREKTQTLQADLDTIKKENLNLTSTINKLENEKHSLTQILSQTSEDKDEVQKLLSTALSDIEVLKEDCINFKEKLYEQEQMIQNLNDTKQFLEVELQNSLSKNNYNSPILDESFEETFPKEFDTIAKHFNEIYYCNTDILNGKYIINCDKHSISFSMKGDGSK